MSTTVPPVAAAVAHAPAPLLAGAVVPALTGTPGLTLTASTGATSYLYLNIGPASLQGDPAAVHTIDQNIGALLTASTSAYQYLYLTVFLRPYALLRTRSNWDW